MASNALSDEMMRKQNYKKFLKKFETNQERVCYQQLQQKIRRRKIHEGDITEWFHL